MFLSLCILFHHENDEINQLICSCVVIIVIVIFPIPCSLLLAPKVLGYISVASDISHIVYNEAPGLNRSSL